MQRDSLLTAETFRKSMLKLEAAYREKPLSKETLEVYYERLNYCDDKRFGEEVDRIIDNEQWFPTVKVFLSYLPEPPVVQASLEEMMSR